MMGMNVSVEASPVAACLSGGAKVLYQFGMKIRTNLQTIRVRLNSQESLFVLYKPDQSISDIIEPSNCSKGFLVRHSVKALDHFKSKASARPEAIS